MRPAPQQVASRFVVARSALVVAVVLFAIGGSAATALAASDLVYRCVLSGAQEVPANASGAVGGGEFRIDPVANTMEYRIVVSGLLGAETAAHIHGVAPPGANAGVIVGLPAGNPKVGVWNYAEAQEADILKGLTYVNVHTAAFPGGEVRGQIVPLNALLDGGQEVPVAATTASGWGTFTIDMVANQLSYHIAFTGLLGVETAAHIHGSVPHGGNAGVMHALPPGTPKVGTWNFAQAAEEDIVSGRTYVNIHSTMFPGGEIRGQIVPVVAPIDGGQEVPGNASTGAGIGLFSIDQSTKTLGYDIRMTGLVGAETAAHIHGPAAPGANAGVLVGLPLGARKLGTWTYPAAAEPHIESGLTYVNVHSTVFAGGELRGQIQGFDCPPAVAAPHVIPVSSVEQLATTPNPFRARTTIHFDLARRSNVSLAVVDAAGRRVQSLLTTTLSPGSHRVAWDGRNYSGVPVASGVYYYVLQTAEGATSRPMTLVR